MCLYIYALSGDGAAPVSLRFCSLLLYDGPRLDLPAAEYCEDQSAGDVDASRHPEHLSPACQGLLTTREEEGVFYFSDPLCTVCVCVFVLKKERYFKTFTQVAF